MEKLLSVITEVLGVSESDIQNIRPLGGMTNINYEVSIENKQYVVRLPGLGTEQFINRNEEKKNLKIGTKLGINPGAIYFDTCTGLKITCMIPGAKTLTATRTKSNEVMKAVTTVFRKLHFANVQMENRFNLYKLMEQYERIAREEHVQFYPRFEDAKKEVISIQHDYDLLSFTEAPCHIDAVYENFIEDKNGEIYLIDWEYSGMFDPLWDIATHMMKSEFTIEEEEAFLLYYFQRKPTEEEQQRILIHKIFQDYLWSLWTLFKEAKGDDFGSYGKNRFSRLERNLIFYEEIYRQKMSV